MANAIKTQSVKKVLTAKKVATPKKAVEKSESVILKTQINNNWKDATRSLSALVKYVNNEGKTDIQKMLDATNKSKSTAVNIKQVANIKNITRLATERELNSNANPDKSKGAKFIKGEQKRLFSLWLVILTIGRLANEEVATNKAKK
jgi:Icc-related predicted phosphoesterase